MLSGGNAGCGAVVNGAGYTCHMVASNSSVGTFT